MVGGNKMKTFAPQQQSAHSGLCGVLRNEAAMARS